LNLKLPTQHFTCSQCGRCCRGFDVVVTAAEIDLYRRRNAAVWFRATSGPEASDLSAEAQGAKVEPFEPVPGAPAVRRIRQRDDGACGFLSDDNRCRIHEELGAAKKPLTCRLFPYAFHAAADGIVVKPSFNCPTIAANEGAPIDGGASRAALESLRDEWFAIHPSKAGALELVDGRSMSTRTLLLLRQNLVAMLTADGGDLRSGIRRIAAVLDDLTRRRVLALSQEDFAEYVSLTVPYAAAKPDAPPPQAPGVIARMLQYGFLYAVAATRDGLVHAGQSRNQARWRRLWLLGHFHRLAPPLDQLNVSALQRHRVDLNDSEIRPIAFHYLRSTVETAGAAGLPFVDELAMAASFLNAACALAAMNADAAATHVDRTIFIQSLTEASDVSHARHTLLEWVLARFTGGTSALIALGAVRSKQEGAAN
jgi:Fe-S-cluster containining protein